MKVNGKQGKKPQAAVLWDRDPNLDLAKQVLESDDNWLNKVEADFVQKSINQRRQNIGIRWALVGIAFAILGGIAVGIWYQLKLSQLREKAARVQNLLQADEPVEGLVLAIQAVGQNRSTPIVGRSILPEVQSSLSRAVQTVRESRRFQEDSGIELTTVAFSSDGTEIASGAKDGTITLWNITTGEPVKFPVQSTSAQDNPQQEISAISFSPDGQQILSGRQDGSVQLWDLQGNLKGSWQHNQAITSVAFTADNQIVTGSKDGSIYLIDLAQNPSRYVVLAPENKNSYDTPAFVAVSPDGRNIAAVRNGEIFFGDSQRKKLSKLNEIGLSKDSFSFRCSVAFSDNQTLLIGEGVCSSQPGSISRLDFKVQEWSINDGNTLTFQKTLPAGNRSIKSVAGVGDAIASVSDRNTIRVWKKNNGFIENELILIGHTGNVREVAFNPKNTQQLVSVSDDGTIRLWDIGQPFNTVDVKYHRGLQFQGQEVKHDGEGSNFDFVTSTAFSPDGNYFAIGRRETVMLFNAQGQLAELPFKEHQDEVTAVAFSPDGKTIASGSKDKTIRLWNLAGKPLITMNHPVKQTTDKGDQGAVLAIAFSPDKKTIVSGSDDGTVRLWDLAGNLLHTFEGHQDEVTAVAFSPDGKTIVSGSKDRTVRIWDVATRQMRGKPLTDHAAVVNSVAFSPDGDIFISGGDDKTIRFWDLQGNPTGIKTLKNAHTAAIKSVLFKDKSTIVSASNDQTIKFWHLDGSSAAEPFQNKTQNGNSEHTTVVFSPNGNTFLTSIDDFKEVGSNLRLFKDPTDLEYLLKSACQRLSQHKVLIQPETEVAREAKETCAKYVWNGSSSTGFSESTPVSSLPSPSPAPSPTPFLLPLTCDERSLPQLTGETPGYYTRKGSTYEYYGSMKKKAPPEGQEVIQLFPSGNRYDGKLQAGKRNGCGMLTFKNGQRYFGEFRNDQYNGVGKFTWRNDDYYQGQFSNGKCAGQGTLVFRDGTFKTGEWSDGKLKSEPNISCDRE